MLNAPRLHSLNVIQRLINHKDILPQVAPGVDFVVLSPTFHTCGNLVFGDKNGAILFVPHGNKIYGMHWLTTPTCRGKKALNLARGAITAVFTDYGAAAIYGLTPRDNRAARVMNRALGGQPCGVSTDRTGRACVNYKLERETWATLSAALSAASGVL